MKFNGILTVVVSVLIVVLLSATCIVPIVESAQNEQVTEFQNTTQRYLSAKTTESFTIGLGADKKPTFNGQPMDVTYNVQYTVWLAALTDNVIVSFSPGTNLLVYDVKNMVFNVYTAETENIISFDNGTYTWTYSGTEYTGSYSFLFYPSNNGTWGMFGGADGNPKVTNGTTIYGYFATSGHSRMVTSITDGVATNLMEPTSISNNTMVAYDGEVAPVVTSTESESGTYSVYTGKYIETPTGGTSSDYAMGFIAPMGYKDISDNDSVIRAMLGIIPLLVFVIPIMIIVRVFGAGRD